MEILVTIKTNGYYYDILIYPLEIDFIQPGLGDCILHFIDGSYLYIYQDEKELTKRIRALKKPEHL